MTKLWVVCGIDTGNYYERKHPIGVYTTEELAREAVHLALQQVTRIERSDGTSDETLEWKEVEYEEIDLDVMPGRIVALYKISLPVPQNFPRTKTVFDEEIIPPGCI